jgi:hypothetical protein
VWAFQTFPVLKNQVRDCTCTVSGTFQYSITRFPDLFALEQPVFRKPSNNTGLQNFQCNVEQSDI